MYFYFLYLLFIRNIHCLLCLSLQAAMHHIASVPVCSSADEWLVVNVTVAVHHWLTQQNTGLIAQVIDEFG